MSARSRMQAKIVESGRGRAKDDYLSQRAMLRSAPCSDKADSRAQAISFVVRQKASQGPTVVLGPAITIEPLAISQFMHVFPGHAEARDPRPKIFGNENLRRMANESEEWITTPDRALAASLTAIHSFLKGLIRLLAAHRANSTDSGRLVPRARRRPRSVAAAGRFNHPACARSASASARMGAVALPPKRVHLTPAAAAANRIAAAASLPSTNASVNAP
jgi:hypothetical protein